eukprot:TRINITY_DN28682_c0_g1_i1.p1 TRINITY_DN28682_c0_g1~~TRINITY_DN28682_c0_g1_i1.p1  ORF type:complete len:525 (+),score=146.82 TRINITY_DN28682_c0_g1_i1:125-1699(+)
MNSQRTRKGVVGASNRSEVATSSRSNSSNRHRSARTGRSVPFEAREEPEMSSTARGRIRIQKRREALRRMEKITTKLMDYQMFKHATVRHMFRALDENKDGAISRREFKQHIKSLRLNDGISDDDLDTYFSLLDSSENDAVEYNELMKIFTGKLEEDAEAKESAGDRKPIEDKRKQYLLSKLTEKLFGEGGGEDAASQTVKSFQKFDENQDGILNYHEFTTALGPTMLNLGLSKDEVNDLCQICDRDNSGCISYADFLQALNIKQPEYTVFVESRLRELERIKNLVRTLDDTSIDWQNTHDKWGNNTLKNGNFQQGSGRNSALSTNRAPSSLAGRIIATDRSNQADSPPSTPSSVSSRSYKRTPRSLSRSNSTSLLANSARHNLLESQMRWQHISGLDTSLRTGMTPSKKTSFFGDDKERFNTTSGSAFNASNNREHYLHSPDKERRILRGRQAQALKDANEKAAAAEQERLKQVDRVRLLTKTRHRLRFLDYLNKREEETFEAMSGSPICSNKKNMTSQEWFK